jgi:Xaa-Pro aminopeptidase
MNFKARVKKISSSLKNNECFYAACASDIFYLSGFSGTFAKIIITRDKSFFITDSRYKGITDNLQLASFYEVIITNKFKDTFKKILAGKTKTFISVHTPLADYINLKKTKKNPHISSLISSMRLIKDSDEIQAIKHSIKINEHAIMAVVKTLKTGITEKDLSAEFEYRARKLGASSVSFNTIVAFDENAAIPHAMPSDRKLQKGSVILLDCGVKCGGYCSDLTRVISFGIIGTRFREIQRSYDIVRKAKKTALKMVKNGNKAVLADREARRVLFEHKLDKFFTHSLGHGLGIDIHEEPYVNSTADTVLKQGMVITCEPGIYLEGNYGIRIEDDYLVTKDGSVKLGSMDDKLILL